MARRNDIPPEPGMTMAELLGEHFIHTRPEFQEPERKKAPPRKEQPPKRRKLRAKV